MKKLNTILFCLGISATIGVVAVVKSNPARAYTDFPEVTVKVASLPAGSGTITSTDGRINCGSTCEVTYNDGDTVTLNFSPASGRTFLFWAGHSSLCGGGSSSSSCSFDVDWYSYADGGITMDARTLYSNYDVTVSKTGTGTGKVSGTGSHVAKSTFSLTATADSGSKFVGWETSGDICYSWKQISGKSHEKVRNTSAKCTITLNDATYPKNLNAVAKFDKMTSTNSSSGGSTTTTTSSLAPDEGTPPAPKTDSIQVAGVKVDASKPVQVAQDKPLVLSGKTTPNATVTLYIFSEPKKVTTTADKDGNWSYTITGLPEGSHHVEAEVTDPKTKKTSKRAKLLEFAVTAAAPGPATTTITPTVEVAKAVNKGLLTGVLVTVLLAGGGAFYWGKYMRKPGGSSGARPDDNSIVTPPNKQ